MSNLQVPVTSTDHTQGDLNAPIGLVEYGDYECPYCGAAFPIVKDVQRHFGKRLCFVFRNFPLTQIHPEAENAAELAEFAGSYGSFWEMHDGLYLNQARLGPPLYLELAQALRLPGDALAEALEHHAFRARVRDDFRGGLKSGVNGTPTFFINGRRHDAGPEDLIGAIEAELARA